MSHTELEARRWQAAIKTVQGQHELTVRVEHCDGRTVVLLSEGNKTEDTIALWGELRGRPGIPFYLRCETREWRAMLWDELKGASC